MKTQITLILSTLLLVFAGMAQARETLHEFSVADLMKNPNVEYQLSGVSFYFGDQAHPPVYKTFGEYPTNKKTNAFNKSDLVACHQLLSLLGKFVFSLYCFVFIILLHGTYTAKLARNTRCRTRLFRVSLVRCCCVHQLRLWMLSCRRGSSG